MRILSVILLLLLTSQVQAANMRWMKNSPASYFTDSDWDIFGKTLRETLGNGADGVTVNWVNPETDHRGSITPLENIAVKDQSCRKVRFISVTPKASGRVDAVLCPGEGDKWLIHSR